MKVTFTQEELEADCKAIFKKYGHARTPIEAVGCWESMNGLNAPMHIKIKAPYRPIVEDIYRKLLEQE